jgi:hypothetical protein
MFSEDPIRLIPPELQTEMNSHESNRSDVQKAREVLEEALIVQFRTLANGLFARLILQGSPIDNLCWWQHYLSQIDRPIQYKPDFTAPSFIMFRKAFIQNIASHHIKPLTLSQLHNIQIRIFGGYVNLWNDVEINHQLAQLGSNLRLAFPGSRGVGINRTLAIIQKLPPISIDGQFILGRISYVTNSLLGPILDFNLEYAISPYMPPTASALAYDPNVVLRRIVMRMARESVADSLSQENNSNSGDSNDRKDDHNHRTLRWKRFSNHLVNLLSPEWALKRCSDAFLANLTEVADKHIFNDWLATTAHESAHIWDFHWGSYHTAYLQSYWLRDLEDGICRFTRIERSRKEIRNAFTLSFEVPMFIWNKFRQAKEAFLRQSNYQIPSMQTLERILEHMINNGMLLKTKKGGIYCPHYEKDKPWKIQ